MLRRICWPWWRSLDRRFSRALAGEPNDVMIVSLTTVFSYGTAHAKRRWDVLPYQPCEVDLGNQPARKSLPIIMHQQALAIHKESPATQPRKLLNIAVFVPTTNETYRQHC